MTRGARALVICPDIRRQRRDEDPAARLAEAEGLALAIGIVVAESYVLPVRDVRPNTLFGEGQVQRIATDCELHEAELVIVDGALNSDYTVVQGGVLFIAVTYVVLSFAVDLLYHVLDPRVAEQ